MIMQSIRNFIGGLVKSFSGKDYLREIHQCEKCGRPSFTNMCQFCETTEAYNKHYSDAKPTDREDVYK